MRVDQMLPSKYLKQSDIDGDQVVTINKVGRVNMAREGDEPEYKMMARFDEFEKPMVLNGTNIKRIARALNSNESDDWIGKKVILYVDPDVEYGGNVTGGLRLKEYKPAKQPTRVPSKHPNDPGPAGMADDVPF